MPSKWTDATERDLLVIMIQANTGGTGGGPRYQWDAIVEKMNELGYDFTKEAVTQHFSKKIMKQHKDRHAANGKGKPGSAASSKTTTPVKTSTPIKTEPKSSAGKRKFKKEERGSDDDEAKVKVDLTAFEAATPSKKAKVGGVVRGRGERSPTMMQFGPEQEAAFEKWQNSVG